MIGFFDSGIGGLTIEQEVRKLLPQYSTIYLGDGAHAPYGDKTHEELVDFTWAGAEWLFDRGAKLVIVACNSASASALSEIQREKLGPDPEKRILGIIRPTVEKLVSKGFDDVAVLSTVATKESAAYENEFKKLNPKIAIKSVSCPTWTPMIESGKVGTPEMKEEVEKDMSILKQEDPNLKAALLACTHYPYVKKDVQEALGPDVQVFEQGKIVAESLKDYLERHPEIERNLSRTEKHSYYTTGDPELSTKVAHSAFAYDVGFKYSNLA